MLKPALIIIAGPTASGKTELAIEVATALHTSIVNADSRQIYKELNIGVAKPDSLQLSKVPHYLVSEISIHDSFGAGDFEKKAEHCLNTIFETNQFAVVSGGTGLYLNALLNGMDDLPEVPEETRQSVNELFNTGGLKSLVEALIKLDPDAALSVQLDNPARVKRALELVSVSRRPLSDLLIGSKKDLPYQVFGYYLNPERESLYQRINRRVDEMIQQGLETEARNLHTLNHLKALQTVGYTEFFDYFDEKCSLETCIEKIKQHTRNYAKRQLTWFKNQTTFQPIAPEQILNTIFADLTTHGYPIHE